MTQRSPLERRIAISSVLIVAGLLVQLATATVVHPLAFVSFVMIACPLVAAGVLLFLWTLVASR
jgi:hypothetical protein